MPEITGLQLSFDLETQPATCQMLVFEKLCFKRATFGAYGKYWPEPPVTGKKKHFLLREMKRIIKEIETRYD